MKPTETEDNVDGGKDVSLKFDDEPIEPEEHAKGFPQTANESFEKEGENLDEKVLNLSSENGVEIVEVSRECVSDAEWVCNSPNGGFSSTASGWPSFNIKSTSPTSLSEEEQAVVAVLQLQHKALEACQKFLVGNAGSDSDEGNDADDEDENEDELEENYDSEGCEEEYKFFERVFAEDEDLRKYYENNYKEGDFYCLVCGGIGKKVWKRFKNCIALLHHSTAILRTKKKRAHRTYAQVICKVVGWHIAQLPAIVLKDLDSSLAASKKLLVEPKKPPASGVNDSYSEPDNPIDRHVKH